VALLSLGSRRDRLESVLTNAATVGFATLAPQQRKGKSHTTASQTHTRQAGYLFSHLPPRRRRSPPLKSHGRRWPCNKYFPLSGSVHLPYLHNPYRRRRLLDTLSLSLLSTTLLLRLASPLHSTASHQPHTPSCRRYVTANDLPPSSTLPIRWWCAKAYRHLVQPHRSRSIVAMPLARSASSPVAVSVSSSGLAIVKSVQRSLL
jgi:hypothetical protein